MKEGGVFDDQSSLRFRTLAGIGTNKTQIYAANRRLDYALILNICVYLRPNIDGPVKMLQLFHSELIRCAANFIKKSTVIYESVCQEV